jgi:hypothetical protein
MQLENPPRAARKHDGFGLVWPAEARTLRLLYWVMVTRRWMS